MRRLRVRELAEQMGLGRASLARLAGLSLMTIMKIYRDPYAEVSRVTLKRLAEALAVDVSELIEDVPDTPLEKLLADLNMSSVVRVERIPNEMRN